MTGPTFDDFSKALVSGVPRRTVVGLGMRAALATFLGSGAVAASVQSASARTQYRCTLCSYQCIGSGGGNKTIQQCSPGTCLNSISTNACSSGSALLVGFTPNAPKCNQKACTKYCGGPGEVCCASGPACDSSDLVCSNGTCVACGGQGQPCCSSGTCGSGLTCSNGTCQQNTCVGKGGDCTGPGAIVCCSGSGLFYGNGLCECL